MALLAMFGPGSTAISRTRRMLRGRSGANPRSPFASIALRVRTRATFGVATENAAAALALASATRAVSLA
jgi:hypothetical protein